MKASLVSRAIRRAALLSLSAGACGGTAAGNTGMQTAIDASTDGVVIDKLCSVTSLVPNGGGGSCSNNLLEFPFNGTAPECGADDAGNFVANRCAELCPPNSDSAPNPPLSCSIASAGGESWELWCTYGPCGNGRRPEGLRPCPPRRAACPAATYLARMAFLEAASVLAFARLGRELAAHGAPRRLRFLARRSARDEVRHARVVKTFAERAGARVSSPRVKAVGLRDLEAIAIENAVEGCVNETYGAALALVQAERARARPFRLAMKRIAEDETRHAELAWAVATWLDTRLSRSARARVRKARTAAAEALVQSIPQSMAPDFIHELGLPTPEQASHIARRLASTLWMPHRRVPRQCPVTTMLSSSIVTGCVPPLLTKALPMITAVSPGAPAPAATLPCSLPLMSALTLPVES